MVDGGIDYFNGDADVNVSAVEQNFLMVKMTGHCFGRKKNYGLTVTVFSEPWWGETSHSSEGILTYGNS